MTAKEQAVKAAYGEAYEKLRAAINGNGWCLMRKGNVLSFFDAGDLEFKGRYARPKSLKGFSTNNGWTRLDERLPEERDFYVFWDIKEQKSFVLLFDPKDDWYVSSYMSIYSHWRPVVEFPKPIY